MSTGIRNALLVTTGLVLALGVYVLHLQSQISLLKQETEALRKQKEAVESLLAEQDEQRAMQKKLDAQLKQFADQQVNRQRDELQQIRQQHQKDLAAAREEKERLLRELQIATTTRSVPVSRPVEVPVPVTETYWAGAGWPATGIPSATTNVSLGKKVTSSVDRPYEGTFAQITDGALQNPSITLRRGTQWVQIDLETNYPLYTITIWHEYQPKLRQYFRDVVVQASDDPLFKSNVQTLFNNDSDNSSGLGVGKDKEYAETPEGKKISAQGSTARYLRFYSKGSDLQAYNAYQEIEVLALLQPVGMASRGSGF